MTGDITRNTFDPAKGFTSVRAQQGRVTLDADTNEQADIARYDTREGRREIIGRAAAPLDAPGFGVSVRNGTPTLSAGRFMLEGISLSNLDDVALDGPQPFWTDAALPSADGTWLAYLEAWEISLSAVETPAIREVALGGPDTATRERLVWQVRWLPLAAGATCAAAADQLRTLANRFDGTLNPKLDAASVTGPCIVSEAAAFRGLENQHYRVEVHDGTIDGSGDPTGTSPTFKWSRDNGAVVGTIVSVQSTAPLILTVDRLGPGGTEGFERGLTVEIDSMKRQLAGQPGILAIIEDVAGDTLTVTLQGASLAQFQALRAEEGVVLRRWDSGGAVALLPGADIDIEASLQVQFTQGEYRSGDHWSIPARTSIVSGRQTQLDWPHTNGAFERLRPHGPARHRAALAILNRAGGSWTLTHDCRALFPPLASTLSIAKAGGEGQSAASGEWLPGALRVRAMRGTFPASGVTVRFNAFGGGRLTTGSPDAGNAAVTQQDVTTDAGGLAEVFWRLGNAPAAKGADDLWEGVLSQRVDVAVIGGDGAAGPPRQSFQAQVLSHRTLTIVGGNAQHGRPGERLEVALRVRVEEGARPIADAVVEFAILNLVFEGRQLDQNTGGNLLASARFVDGVKWDDGTAFRTVRTTTDKEGVAQVQWTLGTLNELTPQRVEARLGDERALQKSLFTAQLAVASETRWEPRVPWLSGRVGTLNRNLQATTDAIAERLEEVSAGGTTFDPFLDLKWRSTTNAIADVPTDKPIPLASFAALSFRGDLIPNGRDTTEVHAHGGIVVMPEVLQSTGLSQVMRLSGNVRKGTSGTRWEWTLSSDARSSLTKVTDNVFQVMTVRVVVVPRFLPGGREGDSTMAFESAFRMSVGVFQIAVPVITNPN